MKFKVGQEVILINNNGMRSVPKGAIAIVKAVTTLGPHQFLSLRWKGNNGQTIIPSRRFRPYTANTQLKFDFMNK
jgi:hypothetical protein